VRLQLSFAFVIALAAAACGDNASDGHAPKAAPAASVTPTTSPPASAPAEAKASAAPPAVPEDPARIAHGKELYLRICAVCHGKNGEGYVADAAPALNHPGYLGSVTDALLRDAIENGRTGSTMSAWSKAHGGPLGTEDVTAVIAFIRSFYQGPKLVLDEGSLPGNPRSDRVRGAVLYAEHCQKCHGARGIEGPNARIGDPAFLRRASRGFLRLAIREGRPPTPMPAFRDALGLEAIDDIIMQLRALARENAPRVTRGSQPKPQSPLPLPKLPQNPKGRDPRGFRKHPETTPLDVVYREMKAGARLALLDARAPSDYLREHIKGAASVPYYDPSPYLDKLPKDTWLVSYCSCPHAESKTLAQKLLNAGFEKVTVLDEGIGAWRAKGHPVVSEDPPAAPAPADKAKAKAQTEH